MSRSARDIDLLTEDRAAAVIGIKRRTLAGWRRRGIAPPHIAVTKRTIRYRVADIAAWVDRTLTGG